MTIVSSGMGGFSEAGSPDDWDLGIGEVYGYRWWVCRLPAALAGHPTSTEFDIPSLRNPPLTGVNNYTWSSGKQEAVCKPPIYNYPPAALSKHEPPEYRAKHEPPEYRAKCGCGFWAYFDPQLDANEVIGGVRKGIPNVQTHQEELVVYVPVFGVIRGTGRVIVGDKGFRSQYAEIVGLCISEQAAENLSYTCVAPKDVSEVLRVATSNYRRLFSVLKGNVDLRSLQETTVVKAPDDTVLYRISIAEAILSISYPHAKIVCDQRALIKYFPPDKNYGPGSAFALDNKYGPPED